MPRRNHGVTFIALSCGSVGKGRDPWAGARPDRRRVGHEPARTPYRADLPTLHPRHTFTAGPAQFPVTSGRLLTRDFRGQVQYVRLCAPGRIRTCDSRFRNWVALSGSVSLRPGQRLDHLPSRVLIIPHMFRILLRATFSAPHLLIRSCRQPSPLWLRPRSARSSRLSSAQLGPLRCCTSLLYRSFRRRPRSEATLPGWAYLLGARTLGRRRSLGLFAPHIDTQAACSASGRCPTSAQMWPPLSVTEGRSASSAVGLTSASTACATSELTAAAAASTLPHPSLAASGDCCTSATARSRSLSGSVTRTSRRQCTWTKIGSGDPIRRLSHVRPACWKRFPAARQTSGPSVPTLCVVAATVRTDPMLASPRHRARRGQPCPRRRLR